MVAIEILKEGIDMEASSLENVKELETIEDLLCVFFFWQSPLFDNKS